MLGMAIRKGCVRLAEDTLPRNFTASDLDHLEIFLAGAAFGAGPVHRHVLPARAGGDALVGNALFLVVDIATDEAHPRLVLHLVLGHKVGRILTHAADRSDLRSVRSHRGS